MQHVTNPTNDEMNIHAFLQETNVESVITEIENHWAQNGKPIYSDLYKEEEGKTYEYVNYVQEGGGVLGVALVGYTYVLERLGFRFLKLAGTSAGAINTLLMAAVNKKNYPGKNYRYQSEMILDEMLSFNFWNLVDGHWFAKRLIKWFISKNTSYTALKYFIVGCLLFTMLFAVFFGMQNFYAFPVVQQFIHSNAYPWCFGLGMAATLYFAYTWYMEKVKKDKKVAEAKSKLNASASGSGKDAEQNLKDNESAAKSTSGFTQIMWVVIFILSLATVAQLIFYYLLQEVLYRHLPWLQNVLVTAIQILGCAGMMGLLAMIAAYLYFKGRFVRGGLGVNPGNSFRKWMVDILQKNNSNTSEELNEQLAQRIKNENMQLRFDAKRDAAQNNNEVPCPHYAIMASDISLGTKAEFPANAKDYWADPKLAHPADFVRASMSIPVFFSPLRINVPQHLQDKSKLWFQKATSNNNTANSTKEVWFVDGGVLSNFPINIFHDPQKLRARMPTFGVKLEDEKHLKPEEEKNPVTLNFGSFLGKVFSTIRFYYDKDFLSRNAIYEKGIAHIDVAEINWLNFDMDRATKIDLFNRGAAAAKTFFMGGEYWVDGKKNDTRIFAEGDAMGDAFKNGFNWEAWKDYREKAILHDLSSKGMKQPNLKPSAE